MSFLKKTNNVLAENLITLKMTRHIKKQDLGSPMWKLLNDEYKENEKEEWSIKALTSMINSIFFQKRVVFVLARNPFREMCRSDRNWKASIGLKNENWKRLIHEGIGRGIIDVVHKTPKGRLIFSLKNQELINLLENEVKIDKKKQLKETIEFAEMLDFTHEMSVKLTLGNPGLLNRGDIEKEMEREKELEKVVVTPTYIHEGNVNKQQRPLDLSEGARVFAYSQTKEWFEGFLKRSTVSENTYSRSPILKIKGCPYNDSKTIDLYLNKKMDVLQRNLSILILEVLEKFQKDLNEKNGVLRTKIRERFEPLVKNGVPLPVDIASSMLDSHFFNKESPRIQRMVADGIVTLHAIVSENDPAKNVL